MAPAIPTSPILQQLPIDVLKIDRSFVADMMVDKDKRAIVRTVLSLARALGMKTTAEGIESEEISDVLRRLGLLGRDRAIILRGR